MTKPQVFCLIFMMALLLVPALPAEAQAEDTPSAPTLPPAPRVVVKPALLPYQVQAAKKIFLSNGGAEPDELFTGGPGRTYSPSNDAMKSWGPSGLSPPASRADLIFADNCTSRVYVTK